LHQLAGARSLPQGGGFVDRHGDCRELLRRSIRRARTSHIGEYVEIRVVDKDNRVQAKAIYNDLIGPDFSFYLARVIPKANAPYRLDWWADHNNTAK